MGKILSTLTMCSLLIAFSFSIASAEGRFYLGSGFRNSIRLEYGRIRWHCFFVWFTGGDRDSEELWRLWHKREGRL
jgi:hypothetical protein